MAAATAAAISAAATVAAAGYSMSQGSGGGGPRPPSYSKSMVKGVAAEKMVLPDKIRGELAARGQFDLPALAQNLAYMDASNTGVQEQMIKGGETYAPREVALRKSLSEMADPNKLAVRDEVGQMVLAELQKGRELTTSQDLSIKDSIRGGQVARGITDGTMPVIDESLAIQRYKDSVYQQRLENAGNFLAMPSFAEITSGLPTGYNPMQSGDTFRLFNPNAGTDAANFASRNYATQAGTQQPNGWMQGVGMIAGAAGRYAGWASSQPSAPAAQPKLGATNSWIQL